MNNYFGEKTEAPDDWLDAFSLLKIQLEKTNIFLTFTQI